MEDGVKLTGRTREDDVKENVNDGVKDSVNDDVKSGVRDA